MAKHIFILAGSHKQAADFARDKNLHPSNWTFLHSTEQVRGWHSGHFIRYGTWENLRNLEAIEELLKIRKFKECSDVRRSDT